MDLEADAGLGLADNDPVALWDDQSGNNNDATQSTGAEKPTFKATDGPGGRPTVSFDAGDLLTLASALPRSNYTIFAVLKLGGGGNATFIAGTTGSLQYRSKGNQQELLVRNTAVIGQSNTNLSTVAFQQINVRWDGTTAKFRLNSASDGNVTNAQSLTQDMTTIGAAQGGGERFNGLISMLRVYTSVLTDLEVADVEAEITTRWGV